MNSMTSPLDASVGSVAGRMCEAVAHHSLLPPLRLVPLLTWKVRNVLEEVTDIRLFSYNQKSILAEELAQSIAPLLESLALEPCSTDKMLSIIESAAKTALAEMKYHAS